ncbi:MULTISPECIES: hypothetical protein [Methylobacterium]|nr:MULTISPECIES: hypothetical protein [Methylobacterium]TXN80387.1 hypothetical protein FV234_17130 [Methylobacterium sp. WL8]
MKRWIVGAALFIGLAAPAFAKDIVLPAKEPAVTATMPDDWDTSVYETEIASVSADGDIVVNIATDSKSRLDSLIKDSKAYLTKNKVKLVGKPTEQTIDFNGTPGQVQRYQATDKNGKAIIDFVTLDASRNRAVLVTVWGSEDDRATNETALSAIMKSVTIPAGGGGGGFWSGGSVQSGKVGAGKSEASRAEAPAAAKPPAPAAVASPPAAAPVASQSLGVRRVLFVTRPSEGFGDVDPRAVGAFLPSEKVITYMEPVGETLVPVAGGDVRFGLVVDYVLQSKGGAILGGQKAVIDKEFTAGKDGILDGYPKFSFHFTLGIAGVDPGDYVLAFTLRDKFSDRTTQVERPFTVLAAAPAPAPTAAAPAPAPTTPAPAPVVAAAPPAPASGLCAQDAVRTDLMASVNGAPDFKDGKRRLKALVEPETVFEDRKGKRMTCRYTSVWDETQDTGTTEKRMKMTFKASDDGKDGIDLDYSFDK